MLKEITYVPQDKCPLDVLAEMGAESSDAWIYLHENAIKKLAKSADHHLPSCTGFIEMEWKETEKYPKTLLHYEDTATQWHKVLYINASDISFNYEPSDPKHIFFLKMAE
ncbi:MAG: hypothetical protein E7314_00215 [Clostridiales bacterium]|nr:hypothetical protein [Clostridiales bacterium]